MKILVPAFALIAMGANALEKPESPFACNRLALTAAAREKHFHQLGPAVHAIQKSVRELPTGYEFEFPFSPSNFELVSEWAAGEHLCCPFFDIDLRVERETGSFWLRLAGRKGTKDFVEAEFARWIKP